MRIKRNDISVPLYSKTNSLDAEGFSVMTWATSSSISIDLQPLTSNSTLEQYGIQKIDGKVGFVDDSTICPVGSVILTAEGNFEAVGQKNWYSHSEVIFKRFEGSLT